MTSGLFYDDPNHQYGNLQLLYDAVPPNYDADRLQFRFEVAWTGGGAYYSDANGVTEANQLVDNYWSRGRAHLVNPNGSGFLVWQPGRLIATLVNDDGRYDPNNSASPLYPNVVKGRLMRYGVRRNDDSSYTWRFTGYLFDVQNNPDDGNGQAHVTLTCQDGWGWAQDNPPPAIPTQQSKNANVLIPLALSLSQWPKSWVASDLDAALQAIPYFWSGTKDLRTLLFWLAEAQADHIYVTGDGALHYKKRTTAFSVAATLAQANVQKTIKTLNPFDNYWNYTKVQCPPPIDLHAATNDSYLWGDNGVAVPPVRTLPEQQVAAGATLVIEGSYADYNAATNSPERFLVSSPSAFDGIVLPYFQFYSGTGKTGNDVTGFVPLTSFLDRGDGFKATFVNNSGAIAYVSWSTVNGFAINTKPDLLSSTFNVDNSLGASQKVFQVANPLMIYGDVTSGPANTALGTDMQKIAAYYAALVSSTKILLVLELEGKPTLQFRDVFDRVTVVLGRLGISDDFRVGMVAERWLEPTGQAIRTTLTTEVYAEAAA